MLPFLYPFSMKAFLLGLCCCCCALTATAQAYRFRADFSWKEKQADGTSSLTMGTAYYDKTLQKIVYDVSFPQKMVLIAQDTSLYRVMQGKPVQRVQTGTSVQFSLFALILNGGLPYFGLQQSLYTMGNVQKNGTQVITEWLPNAKMAKKMGKVLLSQENKQLSGVVFYSPQGEITTKEFFRQYVQQQGVSVPTELIQIGYVGGKEQKKMTNFRNIIINEKGNDAMYNYAIPVR